MSVFREAFTAEVLYNRAGTAFHGEGLKTQKSPNIFLQANLDPVQRAAATNISSFINYHFGVVLKNGRSV